MIFPQPETTENETKNDPQTEWNQGLSAALVSSVQLAKLDIVPRTPILGGFCFEGDLGFIFAARGLGKTWLGMHMAKCIALGVGCGPWDVSRSSKVCYVDGEMPPADIKNRDALLGPPAQNLYYINHEILFDRTGLVINMANPHFQKALLALAVTEHFRVVFFDNLSTLAVGMDENKGPDWDLVLPFLMQLRRAHISVIFIHHAGRSGQMRGHSKREDPSAWIMRLDSPGDDDADEGAHFISRFTKWRNASKQPSSLEWLFRTTADGKLDIKIETASNIDIFRELVKNGVDTCKAVAEEMGFVKSYISKLAKRGQDQGWLEINGSKYKIREDRTRYSAPHADP